MSGGHYPPSYHIQSPSDFIAPRHRLPAIPPQRPTTSTISHAHTSPWINKHNFTNFENSSYYPRNYSPTVRAHHENSWSEFRGSPIEKLEPRIHYDKDEQQESMDLSASHKEPASVNGSSIDKSGNGIVNGTDEPLKKEIVSVIAANPLRESVVKTQPIKKRTEDSVKVKSEPITPDHVESILETMFHSDNKSSVTSASSVIVTAQSSKSSTDLRAESVEKILKSPSPDNFDSTLDSLDSDKSESELIISCDEPSVDIQEIPRNELESDDKIQMLIHQPELEPYTQEVKVEANTELNINKISDTECNQNKTDISKNRKEEITYVEVENELEKMFAGIEEASVESGNPLDVPSISSVTDCTRQDTIRSDTGKSVKKKNSKKSKSTPAKKEPKKHSIIKETSEVMLKRVPVIHVEGCKDNPISVQIINSIKLEEDEVSDGKLAAKRKGKCDRAPKRLAAPYSMKNYDLGASDESWVCVFCKLCAHSPGIAGEPTGELFGPYFISNVEEAVERHSKKSDHSAEQIKKKQKRSLSLENYNDTNMTEHKMQEIWAHENCFIWASGIHLIGSKLVGLEDAVFEALETTCFHCGEKGASIGCRARHCNLYVHYSCGVFTGWNLDSETFITRCHLHKNIQ